MTATLSLPVRQSSFVSNNPTPAKHSWARRAAATSVDVVVIAILIIPALLYRGFIWGTNRFFDWKNGIET